MTKSTNPYNFSLDSLTPTPGHVLIKPAEAEKQTTSGIYLPDSHQETPLYGSVIAVGAQYVSEAGTTINSPVKPGDIVIYKKWGGNEVKLNEVDYQFLKFDDILAVSGAPKRGRGRPKKNN